MHTVSAAVNAAKSAASAVESARAYVAESTAQSAVESATASAAPVTARVAIAGATGYTGQELLRLLARHPAVTIAAATSSGSGTPRRDRKSTRLNSSHVAI